MKRKHLILFLFTGIFLLTACQSQESQSQESTKNQTSSFPIIIEHAFGETIIEKKPERIATIAWGNQDIPLALGIAPVGVSKGNFGQLSHDGLSPWTKETFQNLGINQPVVFDDTDSLDFEAIADSNPDVILAAYSGLTKEEYETLSQIAPVVAYPRKAWQTYWREQTIINATALGMKSKGEALVKETEDLIHQKLSTYPDIQGKSAAFLWMNPADTSSFYAYLPTDPRAAYLTDLGLVFPDSIQSLANNTADFSITLSAEHADLLNDIDIIVTYGDPSLIQTLQKDPLLGKIPAIANGAVVVIDSQSALAGSATPTILGIRYTIDEYLQLINDAAQKVK